MEYVSVRPPTSLSQGRRLLANGVIHYIDSINPLEDFAFDNQFELHESSKWPAYLEFCLQVARSRAPWLIHVHNEAKLLPSLRKEVRSAVLVLHVNDEVVTRCQPHELIDLSSACDLILACSRYIAREIEDAFSKAEVKAPPLEVFYNFVDIEEYNPSVIDLPRLTTLRNRLRIAGQPVILFVGRMIEQKGPHLALRAFRKLLASVPEARIVCVGAPWYSRKNESQFIDSLQAEFQDLSKHVCFTGYVDHSDMPLYYALADAVCVPSIWDDPSPFVTYEAQAMARPVITSRRGGIPEIVLDHVTGRCIDVFNIPLFADIMCQWLKDPVLGSRFGQQGRRRVSQHFELRKAQELMLDIYQRLAKAAMANSRQ